MSSSFITDMLGARGGNPNDYCDIVFGTVISPAPLEVQIDPQKPNLTADFLTLGERVQKYTLNIDGKDVVVDGRLKAGDMVTMIRRDGGGSFYILERRPR